MTLRLLPVLLLIGALQAHSPAAAESAHHAPGARTISLATVTVHGGLRTALPAIAKQRPRVGIALAGGGAKAAASLGVLKVLHREGIAIAAVAGTSMGALIGGLYAAGYTPDEIERIFLSTDWNDVFSDAPPRTFLTQEQKAAGSRHLFEFTFTRGGFVPPAGLTAGQKLTNLLAAKTLAASFEANMDFDRLAIPFRAIATDIESGDAVPIRRGLLHDALRASTAIPLVFQPVEIEGRLLVDGGMSNNLPVDVVRSLGAEVVIAIDASSKLEGREQLSSLVSVVNQSISLQVRRETERQAKRADLVIVPPTDEFSFTDFPAMSDIIRRGEEEGWRALPRIRELLRPAKPPDEEIRYRIRDLSIQGPARVSEAVVRTLLGPALGRTGTTEGDLRDALAVVYGSGPFADVSLRLDPRGDAFDARLLITENAVVSAISVTGNTLLDAGAIISLLDWQLGAPLDSTRVATELDGLVDRLREEGYLLARVERAGMRDDGSTLEIVLSEGRVDSISYRADQTRTRRSLIRRETVTRAGRPLNFNSAASDIQHLYALGYFESIDIELDRSAQGGVDIALRIKERPANRIRLGLRYDLEDAFTGLTDIVVDNITGRGIKAFLFTRYGNYTDLTMGYTSPVLITSNFLHTVQAYYRKRDYLLYDGGRQTGDLQVVREGVDLAFGYQWFRFGDTYLRYRYESDTSHAAPQGGKAEDRIGSWAILSTVDTRDSSMFPHRGILFKGSYEAASESYGGSMDFRKTMIAGQGALPIGGRHTVLLDLAAGFGSGQPPYQEQFGLGGADSLLAFPLPGYHRREFVDANALAAFLSYRWMMAEYQLKAVKAVYLNLGGGGGNVWASRDALSVRDLRYSIDVGLAADTLVGPVRLDLGAGEDRRYEVYFSAGFDF